MDRKTRRKLVLEMHLLGWSQRRIADQLKLSLGAVNRLLKNILESPNRPIRLLLKRPGFPGVRLSLDEMKQYLEICKIGTRHS